MSREDEMVNVLIEQHKKWEDGEMYDSVEVTPEAHYNYYGDRGVADLLVVEHDANSSDRFANVYEVKSDSAIQNSTGANEILRQYNKMRKYFFQDESRTMHQHATFELCFVATEYSVEHLAKNYEMYRSAHEKNLNPKHNSSSSGERIILRGLSDGAALPICFRDADGIEEWVDLVSNMQDREASKVVASVLAD